MGQYRLSTATLWGRLLAAVLALTVFTAWAETLATERLSLEDRTAIDQGHTIEVIVELDQTETASRAAERRLRAGLRYDDAAGLAERAHSYRRKKEGILTALAAESLTVQNNYEYLPMLVVRVRSPAALKALSRQAGVKAIHSIVKLRHMLTESRPLIRQPETVAQGGGGAGATVAVLDTGVDYTRAAFGSCSTPGGSCQVAHAQDFTPNDDGARDDHGHGTNVAGIVLGVAPNVRIAALDVFRNDGFAYSNDVISAINWAIANRDAYNIVAMNLSLGGGESSAPCANDLFATPIANARAAGILAAIASGNENYKDALGSPACVPAAVSVGAVYDANQGARSWGDCTDRSTQADQVTCFSNSADFLTLLAPGSTISAAGLSMSGTSQATPHVAGAIAVLRAAYPNESLDATVARLTNTGVPVTDTNGVTKPRIDLLSAYTTDRTAYALTVNKAGAGSGTVSSSPAGIDCGNQCRVEFAAETMVNLTSTPDAGSTFTGWSGACTGTAACVVTMDAARSVTATFTAVSALSLGEALDNTTLGWNTSGDAGWQGVQLSDRDAARSGAVSDDQISELQTPITGPGTLTFQWRVSSEAEYDDLEFQIDGVLQFKISGESGWETRTVTIGAGTHQLQWIYRKDFSVSAGEDAGWVDAVIFTPTQNVLPNLTVTQVTSPANGIPGGMIEVSAQVTNQGDAVAGAFQLAFLLSDDAVITASDVNTGWGCSFDSLAGGATNTCSGEIGIPATLATGTYYLGAYADFTGSVAESDETNNGLSADNSIAIASGVSSLVVTRTGSGTGKVSSNPAGIDCGSQCSVNFATGAVVTLTAIPSPGSTFSGWSGDCAGSGICRITVDAARNVTAVFDAIAGTEIFPPNATLPSGWTMPITSDAAWTVASDWADEGLYSLRSGRIGHNQHSQVQVSGDFRDGVISFVFYISSEIDYDWLTFSIDGVEQNGWSGEGQRSVSFPVTAGRHTLQWAYEKDASVSLGSDAAWIDSVSLPMVGGSDAATTLITHYYVSILRRQPDPGGLAFWQQLVAEKQAQGLDVKPVFRDMAHFFFNSPEYLRRNTTNTEFTTNLYLTFFQRDPDAGGLAFWLNQLARGMTRNRVMAHFLFSPEFNNFMQGLGF